MSTSKTEHLKLHRWEKDDAFLREEFNENISKLDAERAVIQAALDERRLPVTGQYTGSGKAVVVELGFQPKLVILSDGANTSVCVGGTSRFKVTITPSGFRVDPTGWNLDFTEDKLVCTYIAM